MAEMGVFVAALAAVFVFVVLLLLGVRRARRRGTSRARSWLVFGLPIVGLVAAMGLSRDARPPAIFVVAPVGWQRTASVQVGLHATPHGWGVQGTYYQIDDGR
jgi:uncharacterized membrane protein YhaH (DUF805 family)